MIKYIALLIPVLFLTACTNTLSSSTVSSESKYIESPRQGSGKHELMIFADFQCPACIAFSKSAAPIFEEYANSGKLTIVYKQFPLTTYHKNAFGDAVASLCAAEQGKYLPYKKALYALEESKAGATVSDDDRINLAKTNGLDEASFTQCVKSGRYQDQVKKEIAEGDALQVSGTPTLFLDGKKLDLAVFRGDVTIMKNFLDRVTAE
jgi:protein-disulfide isomerase